MCTRQRGVYLPGAAVVFDVFSVSDGFSIADLRSFLHLSFSSGLLPSSHCLSPSLFLLSPSSLSPERGREVSFLSFEKKKCLWSSGPGCDACP